MKLQNKYLKCFTKEKANELKNIGFSFLYVQNGVYYFENNNNLLKKFSNNNSLDNVKISKTINL